jgi:hypothetical protein
VSPLTGPGTAFDKGEAGPHIAFDNGKAGPHIAFVTSEAGPCVAFDNGEAGPRVALVTGEAGPRVAFDIGKAGPPITLVSMHVPSLSPARPTCVSQIDNIWICLVLSTLFVFYAWQALSLPCIYLKCIYGVICLKIKS